MDVAVFSLVLLALAAFVAAPLYRTASGSERLTGSDAEPRAEALTRALADLEVDRESGLLDDPSYADERAALEAQTDRLDRS